jgi:3-oxoacyl-[acyl-carrier-protein] synthase II
VAFVKDDDMDIMIAGGSDAIFEAQHFGFLPAARDERIARPPGTQMRPFDRTRDGFILGEGSAYFILEELGHALSRGARIYAEITGHGRSCESYHATDPHPEAWATSTQCAGHAPGTDHRDGSGLHQCARFGDPTNDPLETKAIKAVFGSHARHLAISASKPITGHTMGLQAPSKRQFVVLAILHHQEMPPPSTSRIRTKGAISTTGAGARPVSGAGGHESQCGFGGRLRVS